MIPEWKIGMGAIIGIVGVIFTSFIYPDLDVEFFNGAIGGMGALAIGVLLSGGHAKK